MIITRAPLRISLGGGGTDLPSYANKFGGMTLSAAINSYVYIVVHDTFEPGITLKYSKLEHVQTVDEIQHPIIREALRMVDIHDPHIEVVSYADVPAGTGLGSSSSFTCALLKALYIHQGINDIPPPVLAEQACHIEINRLREPVGRQDQYIACYGGMMRFDYADRHPVIAHSLVVSAETRYNLEDGLLLFFTGYSRSASAILKDQDEATKAKNSEMVGNLHQIKALGFEIQKAIEFGNLDLFAELMDAHWQYKRQRSNGMSNPQIDEWYTVAKRHGALGGKIVGAGNGGFLLLYARDAAQLRHAMLNVGLKELRFRFDWEGAKTL